MTDYANDVLVSTAWVQEHLDDPEVRIIEVDEDPSLYAEAHIPGAIGLDWRTDLQDDVRRDFLGPEEFSALMASKGVSNEHIVVLYGDRNNWFAAYTYWYFKYYGHWEVRLVNGPREKWIAEGRPTTTEVPAYAMATYTADEGDEDLRAYRDDVMQLANKAGSNLEQFNQQLMALVGTQVIPQLSSNLRENVQREIISCRNAYTGRVDLSLKPMFVNYNRLQRQFPNSLYNSMFFHWQPEELSMPKEESGQQIFDTGKIKPMQLD